MQKGLKIFLIFAVHLMACQKNIEVKNPITNQKNEAYLIDPKATDPLYSVDNEQHYVLETNENNIGKLLLFIGGSFSIPKNYNLFCNHAASLGFDVISLSYPNQVVAAPLGNSTDLKVFDKYREEVCFGFDLSDAVNVDNLNSIFTRSEKLVRYLNKMNPTHNWGKYLSNNKLIWNKVVLAGHSQGSGHACYIAKSIMTDRVIMLSGPNDYHTYYKMPANWIKKSGFTNLEKQFVLLHINDEIVPFANQLANIQGIGLLKNDQNPAAIDRQSTEKDYRNSMSINVSAISNHSSTVGSNAILPSIWTFMLTSN